MGYLTNLFYGSDDAQAKGDELDAKLRAIDAKDYAPGGVSYEKAKEQLGQDQADLLNGEVTRNLGTGATGDVAGSEEQAFSEGWDQGRDNLTKGVKDSVNAVSKNAFKLVWDSVPWWLMVLAVIGAAVYFLGPRKLLSYLHR